MNSFQAKIGWKRMGKWEKKKFIVLFRFYTMRNRKFQKHGKKIQKIKKYNYDFISCQNRLEKSEKERK